MADNKSSRILKDLKIKKEGYWSGIEEKEVLALFHSASKRVPAYKDFLRKNKINPDRINTLQDFKLVPSIDKENYLHAYPHEKLFWNRSTMRPATIHATSGSTGESNYFYREYAFDLRRETIIENFFRNNKATLKGPTLFIITFGMGIWSAGTGIYTGVYLATNRNNHPISLISPGINKIDTLKILRNLAPRYKQVIIAGYPPFVKDILDDAMYEGLDIKKMNPRFIFTGEAFTEEFRDYLIAKTGINNMYLDTMNTYGTSEFGPTAVETPVSILARRLAYKDKKIFKELFGDIVKTPTIAQYIPYFVNFESENGELLITGDGPTPLIKYRSGDNGGILTHKQLNETLLNNGIDLEKESKELGFSDHTWSTPFVFVYERKNLAASLYGILIYPEFIKTALFDRRISQFLTGKFTMVTKYTNLKNQYLEINLELKKGEKFKKQHEEIALRKIAEVLKHKSSEYRELFRNMKEKVYPKLLFWPYEYPEYFTPGSKQKWVKNDKI